MHYEKFADGTVKCIEDEIPFEIPDSWAWTRLGMICPYGDCVKVDTKDIKDDEWILDLEDIEKETGIILAHVTKEFRPAISTKHKFSRGQLLYSKLRPYLNKVVIADADGYCTSEILPLIFRGGISPTYMQIFLMSNTFLAYVNKISYGVKMPRLGTTDGANALIAIPPLLEQPLISEKVQSCIKIISKLSSGKEDLIDIISSAKSRILDLAIRGKLVPQNPADEPASVLLDRIKAEKESLIKQGKIKRDKKESTIYKGDDNSYYDDIPKNWSVATLNDITTPLSLNDGDWILSENMDSSGNVKLVQLGSVGFMEYIDKGFKYITDKTFDELKCTQIYPGYLLVNRILSDKMNACILPVIDGKIITTVDTCWIAPQEDYYSIKFLLYVLSSPEYQKSVNKYAAGTTRKRISKNNLINLPFLLPPLAEQKRIVETIEKYFAYLDNIAQALA